MDDIIAGIMVDDLKRRRNGTKVTLLHRPNGNWDHIDTGRLCNGLMTEVAQHPKFPNHLILFGHHTKENVLRALLGGEAFAATQITGVDNKDLPFVPPFC